MTTPTWPDPLYRVLVVMPDDSSCLLKPGFPVFDSDAMQEMEDQITAAAKSASDARDELKRLRAELERQCGISESLRAAGHMALHAMEQLQGIDTETECVTIDVHAEITAMRAAINAADAAASGPALRPADRVS